jgi:Glycosyltransferase family 87
MQTVNSPKGNGTVPSPVKKKEQFWGWATYSTLGLVSLLAIADFLLRGLALAFNSGKTDFSELYTSAWLWRHGMNFYNSAIVTAAHEKLVGVSVQIAPIYPPTTLVLLLPFTFLPWGWANLIWLLLGLAGVAATVFLLWRLGGPKSDLNAMAAATLLLSFAPLHQAYHLGNVVLVVFPLVLWSIFLAEQQKDWPAGLAIGVAACLKPQIGVWVLLYYMLRGRRNVFFGALAVGALVVGVLLARPAVLVQSLPDYPVNIHYWFDPGQRYGFGEGALPFHVNVIQVVIYQFCHSIAASQFIAHALFALGLGFWILTLWKASFRVPVPLAISSLLALSFISLYHSVSDATILTLALCWAIPAKNEPWKPVGIVTCALFLIMMLPGHSALMRISPNLSASITSAWWWKLFVARYFVWLLAALNITLLWGLCQCADDKTGDKTQVFPLPNPETS